MEALLSGLVIAAITGITLLAYKHPEAYKKIDPVPIIGKISIGIFIVSFIWQQASHMTYRAIMPYIPIEKSKQAQEAVDAVNLSISNMIIIAGICIAVLLYLSFLHFLPSLIKKDSETK